MIQLDINIDGPYLDKLSYSSFTDWFYITSASDWNKILWMLDQLVSPEMQQAASIFGGPLENIYGASVAWVRNCLPVPILYAEKLAPWGGALGSVISGIAGQLISVAQLDLHKIVSGVKLGETQARQIIKLLTEIEQTLKTELSVILKMQRYDTMTSNLVNALTLGPVEESNCGTELARCGYVGSFEAVIDNAEVLTAFMNMNAQFGSLTSSIQASIAFIENWLKKIDQQPTLELEISQSVAAGLVIGNKQWANSTRPAIFFLEWWSNPKMKADYPNLPKGIW